MSANHHFKNKKQLIIFTDGASRGNPGLAGAGIYVIDQDKDEVFQQSLFLGKKTNNEAEYLAFLKSLVWISNYSQKHEIDAAKWHLDSKLVVEQINKNWKVKEDRLKVFVKEAWQKLALLPYPTKVTYISREKNKEADRLANEAIDNSDSELL
ncbi:MAG: ribonuclease HI family protein [Candidatus Woesebacteria bacterium]|jgi:ribonuclease HI